MMPTIADTPNEPHNRIDQLHDLLQVALGVIRNGVAISDMRQPDCPLIYVNSGFEELTGYRAQEVIGRNCRFLQGAERDQEAVSRLREALSQGEPCCVILRNYRKDGTAFWNELSLHPLFDQQGELSHFVGIQHDISAIIERSKYLIQSERNSAHEAARHARSMTLLTEMSRQLNFALEEEALYQIIIDHTPQILHADYITIALRTPEQQQVVIVAHSSAPAFLVQDSYLPLTASAIERVMLDKQLLIQNSNEREMSGTGMGSQMHAPLITGADTIGAVTVACQQPDAFSQREEHLLLQVAS
jgi:PAS domain S-box-containing protein